MNTRTRLQRLEDARRQNEPVTLRLVFAEDLEPDELPAVTMVWPEDDPRRRQSPDGEPIRIILDV